MKKMRNFEPTLNLESKSKRKKKICGLVQTWLEHKKKLRLKKRKEMRDLKKKKHMKNKANNGKAINVNENIERVNKKKKKKIWKHCLRTLTHWGTK